MIITLKYYSRVDYIKSHVCVFSVIWYLCVSVCVMYIHVTCTACLANARCVLDYSSWPKSTGDTSACYSDAGCGSRLNNAADELYHHHDLCIGRISLCRARAYYTTWDIYMPSSTLTISHCFFGCFFCCFVGCNATANGIDLSIVYGFMQTCMYLFIVPITIYYHYINSVLSGWGASNTLHERRARVKNPSYIPYPFFSYGLQCKRSQKQTLTLVSILFDKNAETLTKRRTLVRHDLQLLMWLTMI